MQVNEEIRRLSHLKKRIEEAIDEGSTEIPKWLEESEEYQTLLRDVEVGQNTNSPLIIDIDFLLPLF